ncbi:THAP domain-containing protein 9, partial [Trachymyrmex cornetzi]
VGYCDYGNSITLERNESEAKEALVFLLVSLNGKWKWPIAYFFKRSITAPILKELIETALILTAEVQISVRSINVLNAQCVEWWQNKMKVRYAAHTLSASVANAIKFLKKVGLKEFQDCDATVKFIEIIDWLFDVLNSRNPFGKDFKQPLTKNRLTYLKKVIPEKINYLFNLEAKDGTKLIKTGRRTFIYGFALALKSILEVAEDIFNERPHYKYLLTYKFSQDHAEILFGKIRSRHGFNNNPNVLQFKYAMKQILMRNDIKTNSTGLDSLELDNDPTGAVFDIVWKKKE